VGGWDESYQVQEFLGSEYASAYYPGVSQAGPAQSISVKAGAEAQADVPMRSVKTAEVAGHVIGLNGPAKNAWIQMEPLGDYYGVEPRGTTDEKGNFRLKGVPPGSYMIMVFQQGDRDGIFEAHGRQKLEVAGENIESLTIVVGRGASVRGRVVVDGPGTLTLVVSGWGSIRSTKRT
jgi:hypothetical protein